MADNRVHNAVVSEHDPRLQAWLETFLHDRGAVAGTVHLLDPERVESLSLRAAVNIPPKVQDITRVIPKGKGMAGLAYARHAPVSTCNLADDKSKDVRPGARAVDAQGAVAVPVYDDHGQVRGVVGLAYAEERQFDQTTLDELTSSVASLP